MSADTTTQGATERERFESALPKFWSRETFVDGEGDVVYAEEWVQGAWAGWTMALAAKSQKGAA